jgi:hypothetical protein
VWESALQSSSALSLDAWASTLAAAEARRDACKLEKDELRQQLDQLVAERNTAILGARTAVEAAETRARATRMRCDELQRDLRAIADQRNDIQAALAEMRVRIASNNTEAIAQTIASLRDEIAVLEGSVGNFDAGDLERHRQTVHRLTSQLRDPRTISRRRAAHSSRSAGQWCGSVNEISRWRSSKPSITSTRSKSSSTRGSSSSMPCGHPRPAKVPTSDERLPARSAAGFASSRVAGTDTLSSVLTSKRTVSRPPVVFATSARCRPVLRTS